MNSNQSILLHMLAVGIIICSLAALVGCSISANGSVQTEDTDTGTGSEVPHDTETETETETGSESDDSGSVCATPYQCLTPEACQAAEGAIVPGRSNQILDERCEAEEEFCCELAVLDSPCPYECMHGGECSALDGVSITVDSDSDPVQCLDNMNTLPSHFNVCCSYEEDTDTTVPVFECPPDFAYPGYADHLASSVLLDYAGNSGPMFPAQEDYDRAKRDIDMIIAARPDYALSEQNYRNAANFTDLLLSLDPAADRTNYDAMEACYNPVVHQVYSFGHSLRFPEPLNISTMEQTYNEYGRPFVEHAEINSAHGGSKYGLEVKSVSTDVWSWDLILGGGDTLELLNCLIKYEFQTDAAGNLLQLNCTDYKPVPGCTLFSCT